MITITSTGNFKNLERYLKEHSAGGIRDILERHAQDVIQLLYEVTPKDTGKTAASWKYEISKSPKGYKISWINDNLAEDKTPIVLLLQLGHATPRGNYVKGRDFINPVIEETTQALLKELRKGGY